MSQNQATVAYPPPSTVPGPYVMPPPVGYPTRDGQANPQNPAPVETTSRGDDGFWKGCCAALCCCWVFDVCCC